MTLDATETSTEETQETQTQEEAAPQGEGAPQEAAPETPAAEAEAAEDGAEGVGEEGAEGEEEQPKADGKKRARAGGFQRKIERLEREREMLLEQLVANRTGQPAQPAAPAKEKTPQDAVAEYVNSLVEQRLVAEREAEGRRQVAAQFQQRTQAVRAQRPDFDEVLAAASDIPVPPAVQQALLTSPAGPEIMYQLASNPAELARISALPPLDAAREIGRLEAKASVSATPKTAPKPAARKPTAPAPITPVTARGPTNVKPVDQMSYEEYSAWRNSQRNKR